MNSEGKGATTIGALLKKLSGEIKIEFEVTRMEPLFKDETDYNEFIEKHNVQRREISPLTKEMYVLA